MEKQLNGIRDLRGRDLSCWSLRADLPRFMSSGNSLYLNGASEVQAQCLTPEICAAEISDPVQLSCFSDLGSRSVSNCSKKRSSRR